VFSPYYAWARRRKGGVADPDNHCALNVALYGPRDKSWSMTERGVRLNHRERDWLTIGPSQLHWTGNSLHIHINEMAVPLPRRIRGTVRLHPQQLFNFSTALDAEGRHRWGPLAPHAAIEVDLQSPAQHWTGHAYLDSNEGDEPVERAFTEWDWSRSRLRDGSTAVLYDVEPQRHDGRLLALHFSRDGVVRPFEAPGRHTLPRTGWRLPRRMHGEAGVRVLRQLEDTPFYQRCMLQTRLLDESVTSFHETLNVPRLVSPVVQAMLPWRMPRRS